MCAQIMTLSGDGGGPPCARAEVQAASLLRVLGRGGTGTVWLVADAQHPGEQRALKVVLGVLRVPRLRAEQHV